MSNKRSQSLHRIWLWSLPVILALVSVGCGLSETLTNITSSTSEPHPTRIPLPTFTPTAAIIIDPNPGTLVQPTPTESPEPTPVEPSPTPPPPPTDTPVPPTSSTVTIVVQKDMNVRGGPGTNFPAIGTAPAGASSTAVGRNADSSWVQVEYPPGSSNTGWVYVQLVQIKGDLQAVAVVSAPAVTNPPPQQPDTPPPPAPEPPKYQFTPAAWHANGNEAIVHFRGTIRDEGGNPVNGFSVLVDNGSWSVLAHPTGASHHYPDKPDGEWDVVIPDVRTGVGWWTLTVVSYDCPNFETFFDAQCKQFTRLSEDIRVEVIWPDETIIWADWTCHRDCNQGLYTDAYRRP